MNQIVSGVFLAEAPHRTSPVNAKAQKEKSVEKPARQSPRVLLITGDSDDPLRASLESTGLEIVGVCAGAAALISLQRSRPQLVIARTAAKGISTQELARMLRQNQDGPPLVLVGAEAA